ncbi:transglycosylase domain-containing protein [Mechercharimyces sp. CAU 1602]|uniref:transglycosylase domain-containing protein n=1 Tax=Mechercharimyces sp. CAU 1602 TaxID=2973933 RepID=UPI002163A8A0|nr:transglycosylase domain-containing protein [Mechercharimyces sp. CAU 1602]MCS1350115.1 penicillin-binding protein [Mechercharimyces sp. CAU 1602]
MKTKPDPSIPDQKKRPLARILRGTLLTLFIFFVITATLSLATVGAAIGTVAALVKDEPIRDKNELTDNLTNLSEHSIVYFGGKEGEELGALRSNELRQVVNLDDVNKDLIEALIATEDRTFWEHEGISPRGFTRALKSQAEEYLFDKEGASGGSTLTQQLVKNQVLQDRGKDLDRKAKELFLALRVERLFSKEEILTAYLNSLFFGKGYDNRQMYGVHAAAEGLFKKNIKDLNLAQSAYLAGMAQRPNAYNPYSSNGNTSFGKDRMKEVLYNMLETKKITKKEYEDALAFDIEGSFSKRSGNSYTKYPHIMEEAYKQAYEVLLELDDVKLEELSDKEREKVSSEYHRKLETGGYRIYTTIDKKLYDAMNKSAKEFKGYGNDERQVGAVLMDNHTGAVLSFVGGRDFNKSQQNFALNVPKQPGSTIKPLLDYGPAMEEGIISPNSIIIDEETRYSNGQKAPSNAGRGYIGAKTARYHLTYSYNTPAVKLIKSLGVNRALSYLDKMNFPYVTLATDPVTGTQVTDKVEPIAIGGFTYGFTVERMTAGYAMLANEGKFNEPHLIAKITDNDGNIVYKHESENVEVLSSQVAYWTTDMLQDVVNRGTATAINKQGYPYLAGKTGTTNNDVDAWFIGYTPDVSLGLWMGYERNRSQAGQSYISKAIWNELWKTVVKTNPDISTKANFTPQPPMPNVHYESKPKPKEEKDDDNNGGGNNGGGNNGGGGGNDGGGGDDGGNNGGGGGNDGGGGNGGNDGGGDGGGGDGDNGGGGNRPPEPPPDEEETSSDQSNQTTDAPSDDEIIETESIARFHST